jgi:hypothetical protein
LRLSRRVRGGTAQRYASHTLGDHTSLAALVEKRFMSHGGGGQQYPSLTLRDANADTLEDLFDSTARRR